MIVGLWHSLSGDRGVPKDQARLALINKSLRGKQVSQKIVPPKCHG